MLQNQLTRPERPTYRDVWVVSSWRACHPTCGTGTRVTQSTNQKIIISISDFVHSFTKTWRWTIKRIWLDEIMTHFKLHFLHTAIFHEDTDIGTTSLTVHVPARLAELSTQRLPWWRVIFATRQHNFIVSQSQNRNEESMGAYTRGYNRFSPFEFEFGRLMVILGRNLKMNGSLSDAFSVKNASIDTLLRCNSAANHQKTLKTKQQLLKFWFAVLRFSWNLKNWNDWS